VAKDQLVFAKGYGYREYGQRLPMTPDTMFQMAYKGLQFRIRRFSDFIFEFVMDNGQVTALKQKSPVGEYTFPRK
jgi:hypothetical protein